MAIGTTIRELRKARGLTLNQMATLIESDVGNLSRLERGVQGFSEAMLGKIAGVLEVPVARLFIADEMHIGAGHPPDVPFPKDIAEMMQLGFTAVPMAAGEDSRLVQIPLVNLRLSAGIAGFKVDPEYDDGRRMTGLSREWVERNGYSPAKLVAIKVRGESMEPSLYEDDLVVLNTADTKLEDGAVFAVNYEGEPVVKRLSRDAGEWWLTSDNPDQRKYHRKICRGDACIIVGRVVRKESDRI